MNDKLRQKVREAVWNCRVEPLPSTILHNLDYDLDEVNEDELYSFIRQEIRENSFKEYLQFDRRDMQEISHIIRKRIEDNKGINTLGMTFTRIEFINRELRILETLLEKVELIYDRDFR